VSQYQKGKTDLYFTEARDSEWQLHQLGHMQVCTSLQTDNHTNTPPLSFFTGRMPFLPPNQQRQSTEGKLLVEIYWKFTKSPRNCLAMFDHLLLMYPTARIGVSNPSHASLKCFFTDSKTLQILMCCGQNVSRETAGTTISADLLDSLIN